MSSAEPSPDWPALRVADWEPTRRLLHMATQIVGKLRMDAEPMVNHWWQVTLYVSVRGLSTGLLHTPGGPAEIEFDLADHRLRIATPGRPDAEIPLRSASVAQLYADIERALARLQLGLTIWPVPVEVPEAIPFADDDAPLRYVAAHAHAFWGQLVAADAVLRRFRSEFAGKVSPVHFFWGSFDLAVTRFSGRTAPVHPGGAPNCADWVMVEGYSHELTSCGFWPGGGEEGTFYAYAYPEPDGFRDADVPDGARYEAALGQFVLPYERVRTNPDPAGLLLAFLRATHRRAAELAGWPALDYAPVPHG